jgi:tetratricopeptide (TPR) repeat protein
VVTVMVAAAMLIAFLNYSYRTERVARAEHYFKAGNAYLANERYEEAIGQYRDALSISHSAEHRMALAEALTKAGHWDEAIIYWDEIMRELPSSGRANLGLARVLAAQGQTTGAVVHYQRAIYGLWPDHSQEHRLQARMELVETLNKAGRRAEAQAELMSLAANSPADPAARKQIARMCTELGLFKQAADLVREVVVRNPRDAEAFDRLADAEFAQGDYSAARDAYRAAVTADAADTTAEKKADLCERIMALDPTLRGLSRQERFERSRELLSGTLAEVTACAAAPQDVKRDVAQAALARTGRPASWSDAAEANMAAAEQLWPERLKVCAAEPAVDDPIAYVMNKLGRR